MRHRIVSFLPSATEMVYALGLGSELAAVSHECDHPDNARTKPVVVRPALPLERMSLAEIDRAVSERLGQGGSLYEVDEALMRSLKPTLLLTQDLCQVCAPSGNEVSRLLKYLDPGPEILWLTPHSIDEIHENLREVGRATGCGDKAEALIAADRKRIASVRDRAAGLSKRRVFCLEWIDPVYCSGHWVPEMVDIAGGEDRLGRRGTDSVRIDWSDVVRWDPEVLIVLPCGFRLAQAVEQARALQGRPGWNHLTAVKNGNVFAVDANAYFARPGPRVVDGVELLAHLIHPEVFGWTGGDVYRRMAEAL